MTTMAAAFAAAAFMWNVPKVSAFDDEALLGNVHTWDNKFVDNKLDIDDVTWLMLYLTGKKNTLVSTRYR